LGSEDQRQSHKNKPKGTSLRDKHRQEHAENDEDEDEDPFNSQRKSAKSEPPKRISKIDKKLDAAFYYYKHMYGCVDEDSDDEEYAEDVVGSNNYKKLKACKDTETRTKIKNAIVKELAPKLSNTAVFFTLMKGFVGSGILFLPNGFSNAGWLFSNAALLFSMWITLVSILLLLRVSDKYEGSFSELAELALGRWGKLISDFTLAFSQTGMTCAGVAFICQNSRLLLLNLFGLKVEMLYLGII